MDMCAADRQLCPHYPGPTTFAVHPTSKLYISRTKMPLAGGHGGCVAKTSMFVAVATVSDGCNSGLIPVCAAKIVNY